MAPRDATKVDKDVRRQEQAKRRRTPGTTLGIEKGRQDKIIRRCMTASIEGMQRVFRAVETETVGGDG